MFTQFLILSFIALQRYLNFLLLYIYFVLYSFYDLLVLVLVVG